MRVALLSSIQGLSDDAGKLRAFARIGGRTVLERQLDFALSLGCEQIACLSDGLHRELIDLQHDAEAAGVRFQVLRDVRPLSGLVKAADELLVVTDGLALDEGIASTQLEAGKAVLTLPAESAVPLGFERLDRDLAWAGVMLISGSLIERLGEMPADIDPQSSLLRLALQSGIRTRAVTDTALIDHDWMIVQDAEALQSFENRWLGAAAQPASFVAPVSSAADYAAHAVLRRHANPAKAARAVGGLGYGLLAVAIVCAYFAYPIAGFVAAGTAAFAARFSLTTSAIAGGGRELSRGGRILAKLPPATLDLVLIGLVVLSVPTFALPNALFAAVILIGLLRLAVVPQADSDTGKLQQLFEDRGVLALALCTCLVFGKLILAIQIFASLLLVLLLYQTYSSRITRA